MALGRAHSSVTYLQFQPWIQRYGRNAARTTEYDSIVAVGGYILIQIITFVLMVQGLFKRQFPFLNTLLSLGLQVVAVIITAALYWFIETNAKMRRGGRIENGHLWLLGTLCGMVSGSVMIISLLVSFKLRKCEGKPNYDLMSHSSNNMREGDYL